MAPSPAGSPRASKGVGNAADPNYLRYTVSKVELRLVRLHGVAPPSGTAPVTEGPRPYTWRHDAQQAGSDGLPADLALLDWKPTNTDKAVLEGDALDGTVEDRWDDVCVVVAEPARVLWTFHDSPLGPDEDGWRLDGVAWPDDPGTRRSQPVDTRLTVRETWRTGTFLDGLLPYKAAEVVGAFRPCPGVVRVSDPRRRAANATSAPPSVVDSAARRQPRAAGPLEADAVGGARFPAPVAFGALTASQAANFCFTKVLEAPFEVSLTGDVPAGLPEGLEGGPLHDVLKALDEQRRSELRDVVRLSGGPHRELTLLIVARSKMVAKDLFGVQAFDSTGNEITGVTATFTLVSAPSDLPTRWVSPGPWRDDVLLAVSFIGAFGHVRDMDEFVVKISLPAPALHVDIGIRPLDDALHGFGLRPPSWYLAVIEGLSEREVRRSQDDGGEGADDADGLDNALDDPGHALLLPDAEYQVIVTYTGEVGSKPLDPEEGQDPDEIVTLRTVDDTEQRTFFTDAEAPRSLDPWMLAQFPAPDERHHFFEDPVVVVFATDDVLELFAAYDRTLRAVARAASFRGSDDTPEAPFTHLFLAERFSTVGELVLSPWEATVRRLFGDRSCGDFDPDSDGHGRAVLPFLLDPLTDYVMDLEAMRPDGTVDRPSPRAGDVGDRPRYRQRFTTSRYASRAAFAEDVRTARVVSRRVPDSAPLDTLGPVVTDDVMDRACARRRTRSARPPDRTGGVEALAQRQPRDTAGDLPGDARASVALPTGADPDVRQHRSHPAMDTGADGVARRRRAGADVTDPRVRRRPVRSAWFRRDDHDRRRCPRAAGPVPPPGCSSAASASAPRLARQPSRTRRQRHTDAGVPAPDGEGAHGHARPAPVVAPPARPRCDGHTLGTVRGRSHRAAMGVAMSEQSELHVTVRCPPRSGGRLIGATGRFRIWTRVHAGMVHQ